MARKKFRGSIAELALTKAAAWAWYQHQSGSEAKPITREYDLTTRVRTPPRPSRYRLEAMRLKVEDDGETLETSRSVQTDDNSLLDTYELDTLARQLDLVMKPSSTSKFGFYGQSNPRECDHKNLYVPEIETTRKEKQKRMNNKKKMLKRLLQGNAVMCGAREDVAANAVIPISCHQSNKE